LGPFRFLYLRGAVQQARFRPLCSFDQSRAGSFVLPMCRASVGPDEGGEPPGDTPELFRLGGPPQA
jgi:hypothetical protein